MIISEATSLLITFLIIMLFGVIVAVLSEYVRNSRPVPLYKTKVVPILCLTISGAVSYGITELVAIYMG